MSFERKKDREDKGIELIEFAHSPKQEEKHIEKDDMEAKEYDAKHTPAEYQTNAHALIYNIKYAFTHMSFAELKPKDEKKPGDENLFGKFSLYCNQLTYCIQEEILAYESAKQRAIAIEKWIKELEQCWNDGNHAGAQAICYALTGNAITNLQLTKNEVSREPKDILKQYEEIFASNGRPYKEKLASLDKSKAIVPCLSIILATKLKEYLQRNKEFKDAGKEALKNTKNIDDVFSDVERMQSACKKSFSPEEKEENAFKVSTNHNEKVKRSEKMEPRLIDVLLSEIKEGGQNRINAINSLFDIISQMETKAKLAFYNALKNGPGQMDVNDRTYENLFKAYERLATGVEDHEKAQLKAEIKDLEENILLTVRNTTHTELVWSKIIKAIPRDPLNNTDIFNKPVSLVNSNNPRHEDIRRDMTRDLNNYRYVAPKGAEGKQDAGPLGGWYIGCYQTLDGKIHTQRFMVKRENQLCKNIIEAVCGRLKAALVNMHYDYTAATYLARKSDDPPTGENTYAVSIAFDNFKATHEVAGLKKKIMMAGTKKLFDGDARKVFKMVENLHDEEHYDGLEEALLSAWWTGDNDVHTGNIGIDKKIGRFIGIDHAGGMIELGSKIYPERDGILQNSLRVLRPQPEPTYHAAEYPSSVRNGHLMADAIKRCTHNMSAAKIKEIIDDEIDQAVKNFELDPEEFRNFAIRVCVPKESLPKNNIKVCAEATKKFLYERMYDRLINLRQFGNEIELSLCFEYNDYLKDFVVKDKEKLARFVQENPNFSSYYKHHFRGESHGKELSSNYNLTHNKMFLSTGKKLEDLLKQERNHILEQKEKSGIKAFMQNDFDIPMPERAQKYVVHLNELQQILQMLPNNPYQEKIKELIEFLELYSSEASQKSGAISKRQHLVQVCDRAYSFIQEVYEKLNATMDNEAELSAKIQIHENFRKRHLASAEKKDASAHSDFVQTVREAAFHLEKLATDIQYEENLKENIASLEEKRQELEKITRQLSSVIDEKKAHQSILDSIARTQTELQPKTAEELAKFKYYPTTIHLFDTTNEATAYLEVEKKNITENIATCAPLAKATIESTVVIENKTLVLDNPHNKGKGLMLNQAGASKIYDIESPENSLAGILAKLLLPYMQTLNSREGSEKTKETELRDYIQEEYIKPLQDKKNGTKKPELITSENLKELIDKLVINNKFHCTPPSGFFAKSNSNFAKNIYEQYRNMLTDTHPQLISWANILVNTLKLQGHQPKDMYIENSNGNTEFARIFLIFICAQGADLAKANRTGYEFTISNKEIDDMKDIINNSANPLHNQIMSGKLISYKKTEKELSLRTTAFSKDPALKELVGKITENLAQSPDEKSIEQLKEMKKGFMHDRTQLKTLDMEQEHKELFQTIVEKIKTIDARLTNSK